MDRFKVAMMIGTLRDFAHAAFFTVRPAFADRTPSVVGQQAERADLSLGLQISIRPHGLPQLDYQPTA